MSAKYFAREGMGSMVLAKVAKASTSCQMLEAFAPLPMVLANATFPGMEPSDARRKNLRALINAAGKGPAGEVNRAALAKRLGVSYAELNQIIGKTPTRNLGERRARDWERRLGLSTGWLDQQGEPWLQATEAVASYDSADATQVDIANEPRDLPLRGDSVVLPRFDVRASMGLGITMPERDTIIDLIRVPVDWVRANFPYVTNPNNLKIITGYGDSMKPTFAHGDPIIIDVGVTTMDVDTVYVFALDNEIFIKRIQRLPGRAIRVISDNRALMDPFELSAEDRERVTVIGRAVTAIKFDKIA